MEKKMHWTQTPEGKKKMAAAMKKRWAKKKKAQVVESKAATIVKKKVGKSAEHDFQSLYHRAVEAAILRNEVPRLMNFLAHAVLMTMIGGAR